MVSWQHCAAMPNQLVQSRGALFNFGSFEPDSAPSARTSPQCINNGRAHQNCKAFMLGFARLGHTHLASGRWVDSVACRSRRRASSWFANSADSPPVALHAWNGASTEHRADDLGIRAPRGYRWRWASVDCLPLGHHPPHGAAAMPCRAGISLQGFRSAECRHRPLQQQAPPEPLHEGPSRPRS